MKAKITEEQLRRHLSENLPFNQIAKLYAMTRQGISDRARRLGHKPSSRVVVCANAGCKRTFTSFNQPHKKFCCAKCLKTSARQIESQHDAASGEKKCCGCKQKKPLASFSYHSGRKDGRQAYCKSCNRLRYTPKGSL